jgi:hypothetical protein
VERAGNVIHDFIVAAARDSSEAAAADSRFAEIFLASALPNQDPDAFPESGSRQTLRWRGMDSNFQFRDTSHRDAFIRR